MSQVEALVRKFIMENFFVEPETLTGETSLVDSGIIDSTGIIDIIFFIEKEFGVVVPDRDVIPENMDSIINITKYILSRKVKSQE